MIGQRQIIVDKGTGDCFRACVASILELPNNDDLPNVHGGPWFLTWQDWLAQFGLTVGFDTKRIWRETHWIASVKSKNFDGTTHAIVMKGGKVAFDPSTKRRYRRGESLIGADVVVGGYWFEVADVSLLHKLHEYKTRIEA